MPPVVIAAAGYAAAQGAAAIGVSAATAAFAASAASAITAHTMAPSRQGLMGNPGLSTTLRSSIESHKIIYGTARTGGVVAHITAAHKTQVKTPGGMMNYHRKNGALYLVVPFAGHEVDGLDTLYLDGVPLTLDEDGHATNEEFVSASGWSLAHVAFYTGTSTQLADPDMVRDVEEWTDEHRLQGVAYARVRLIYSAKHFPNGIPNVTATIRGKKLYDPRTGMTSFSDNWALAVRDYLTSSVYGLGCMADEIHDESIIASANISDENVPLKQGGSVKRYCVNGVLDTAQKPLTLLEVLSGAGAGALPYIDGAFHVYAGAYDMPSASVDADWLRGEVSIHAAPSLKERFNTVRGVFANPDEAYQIVDFPEVKHEALLAALGSEIVTKNIELPLTNHVESAQRIARLMLMKEAEALTLSMPLNLRGLSLKAWDVIQLNLPEMGWQDKTFRIVQWALSEDGGVDITLKEETAQCYQWDASQAHIPEPSESITMPNASLLSVPGVPSLVEELYVTTDGSGVKTRVNVSWQEVDDAFAERYRIKLKKETQSDFVTLGETATTYWVIEDLSPGKIEVQLVSVSPMGVESEPAMAHLQVAGLTAAPVNVAGFTLQAQGGQAHVSWQQASDLDVRVGGRIRLRHSPQLSGATWSSARDLVPALAGVSTHAVIPLLEGTYMVKAVDSSGNESLQAATVVVKSPQVVGLNVVETLKPAPAFDGTLSGLVPDEESLILNGLGAFDSTPDTFDAAAGSFDGYNGFVTSGHYDIAETIDLGYARMCRITATMQAVVSDERNVFDVTDGSFDGRTGQFDGDDLATIEAIIEMQTIEDDPESPSAQWSPWQPLTLADIQVRAVRFRVRVESQNSAHNIRLSGLMLQVDMPDITHSSTHVVPAVGARISYAQPFYEVPSVNITLQNALSGDYFELSQVDETGFDVLIKNAAGTQVSRSLAYLAKGY